MGRKSSPTVRAALITGAAVIIGAFITGWWSLDPKDGVRSTPTTSGKVSQTSAATQESRPLFNSIVLDSRFFPSGWIGDGKHGTKYLSLEPKNTDINGESRIALRIVYSAGPEGWAGVYWQYPDGNWGGQPGLSFVGAREITFLARGVNGSEVVEFKSGGIRGQYSDSFEVSLGKVALTKEWKNYRIDLQGKDLSSVIGAFAWVAPAARGGDLSFWLADMQVR